MHNEIQYPVLGRSAQRNRQIAGHVIGHAFITRVLGSHVHLVTIVPGDGFEGRCVRSALPKQLTFERQTTEVLSICERLEGLTTPELGGNRVSDAESIVCAQSMVIELVAGEVAEQLLHPDDPSLGAEHDGIEARAIARVICAAGASPAVAALVRYAEAEARALLLANRDIVDALVEALIERGALSGDQVDETISQVVAMRLIKIEQQRREDWKQRQQSAENFEQRRTAP
jgi:hypothetical protein